jgi:hypothetical protein
MYGVLGPPVGGFDPGGGQEREQVVALAVKVGHPTGMSGRGTESFPSGPVQPHASSPVTTL